MSPKRTIHLIIMVIFLTNSFQACTVGSKYTEDVRSALEEAGENAPELVRVLDHFASHEDSLKLEAAVYLIGNMEGHCFVDYYLFDTSGAEVPFDVLDYPDYDALQVAADSIEEERGELDYDRRESIYDLQTITADFLIEEIDLAFRAWRERPWAKGLSYEQFLAYVLPYRGSNEPLEAWRAEFFSKYQDIPNQMVEPTDPIEAARIINDDIMTWFGFDPRFYYHPTDQSLSEMRANGLGRCEDMTNVTIYAMRANGLAVTSDYTPFWANTGNNHAWNAIVNSDGEVVPFMGAEANPGEYGLANKLAKVYRKTFGKQKDNLIFQDNLQEEAPRWLKGKSYVDVTADYVDAVDIEVPIADEIPDSVNVAYLCVFNSGEWKAIHWGWIKDSRTVTFSDMGTGIAYLPAFYLNEEIVPCGPVFIASDDGGRVELRANQDKPETLSLNSTTRRKQAESTDGIDRTWLTPGVSYSLSYWDDGWQSAGSKTAGDQALVFEGVPASGVYWLVAEDSAREERVFTVENGLQIWW